MIHRYLATVGERSLEVTVEALDGAFRVSVDGRERIVDARRVEGGAWSLIAPGGGPARLVDVDGRGSDFVVGVDGHSIPLKLVEGRRAALAQVATRPRASGPTPVRAPMPGRVVKVLVRPGEEVKSGQGVVVIEAMKMENELRAPRDGTVVEVTAQEAQAVEAGQALVTIG
jgi:acetyl/propionyl-CoA carboxylase alpha subunit